MLTLPRKGDAYSPLYCLAALGSGGLVFTFGFWGPSLARWTWALP
ncbi:hypothetical protein [Roseovarius nitratireducens]